MITQNLVVAVAVAGTFAVLQRSSNRKSLPSTSGQYHLKMPMFYGIMGVIGWAFGTYFLSMIVISISEMTTGTILIALGVTLSLFVFGSFCFLYYWNHQAKFDETSIEVTDHFGYTTTIKWSDVSDISFGFISGQLTIKSADRTLKVHQHLAGVTSLVEVMESTTRWTAKELKLPFGRK